MAQCPTALVRQFTLHFRVRCPVRFWPRIRHVWQLNSGSSTLKALSACALHAAQAFGASLNACPNPRPPLNSAAASLSQNLSAWQFVVQPPALTTRPTYAFQPNWLKLALAPVLTVGARAVQEARRCHKRGRAGNAGAPSSQIWGHGMGRATCCLLYTSPSPRD